MTVLSGTEVLQVLPVQANGQPAAETQQVTTQDIANLSGTSGISFLTLDGATSGSTIIAPLAVASGTLTVPSATDRLVARATTDTLSNKTLTDPIETNTTRSTVQLDKTTSVALSNITGLVQTVVPGTYAYRIYLDTTSTVNGGVKAAFKFTATVASALNAIAKAIDAAALTAARFVTATDQASILASTTATVACEVMGTIVVTTGGTLQLQFAQNVSHADTSSVLVGSSMTFTRLS